MENIFIIYGDNLRNARNGLKPKPTQEEMADALGMNRSTYTNWEGRGAFEISRDEMDVLIKMLHVTSDALTNVPHGTEGKPDSYEVRLLRENTVNLNKLNGALEREIQRLKLELEECKASRGGRNIKKK